MSKPKVVVTRKWPESVESQLKQLYDVQLNEDDQPMSVQALQAALATADAVLPTVTDQLTTEVLSTTPMKCRMLGNFGVGFNHIDLEAAKAAGLVVSNTPGVLTDCTADIAMLLMLMVARRGGEGERQLRAGEWHGWGPTHLLGSKMTGKTLGLIGYGRIAQAVAKKAHHGFGMKVIFFSPRMPDQAVMESVQAQYCDSVDKVLQQADFVSLHCPGGQATYHLLDADKLGLMKSSAYLINTARGDVVDNQALIAALKAKQIAGAGLDVFEGEPNLNQGFLTLENAVLLPHMGSATEETRTAMGECVLENLALFFAGKPLRDSVF